MTNRKKFHLFCGVATAALMLGVEGAQAIDEIVVTAQRRETSLQNTPVAVSAYSTNQLRDRNIVNLQDVSDFTPGLEIVARPGRSGGGGAGITIRGIGADSQDSQSAVGSYIDEVYYPSAYGNVLGLLDVERVEVLRGPQGTLFGRNTISGAIQYVTKKPEKELGGYVTGTVGSFDRRAVRGAINLPLHETLSVRIAGMHDDVGGYVEDLLNGFDRGAETTAAARVRALWEPTDRLSVDIKYEHIDVETNGRATLIGDINPMSAFVGFAAFSGVDTSVYTDALISPNFSPGDYQTFGYNAPDFSTTEHKIIQGIISYDITDNLTVKSITAKQNTENNFAQDFDLTPVNILTVRTDNDLDVFTQELQLTGALFSDRLNFTVGGYYYLSDDIGGQNQKLVIGNGPLGDPQGTGVVKTESYAVYGQGTFDLTEQLSISAGARYTDESIDSSLLNETAPLNFNFTDVSPHAGIQYQFTPNIMAYGKASKGFRAGGFTANRALTGGGMSFDPETAWTYEGGARFTLFDRLRFNPTYFYTKWKDVQSIIILFTGSGPVAATDNVGDAKIQGIELESELVVTDEFTLNGALAWLDSEYTSIDPTVTDVTLQSDLRAAPDFKYTIGGRYESQVSDNVLLTAAMNYAWTDKLRSSTQDGGATFLPSRGLLSARVQADYKENVSLSFFANNITNKYYLVGANDFAQGMTVGNLELDVGRPRAFGIEATVKY